MSQLSPSALVDIWRKYDAMEQQLSAPLSERMLELAGVCEGLRVLDLATGRGEPAIRAAHRVGPSGEVHGVDVVESMLQMARDKADAEGVNNLSLHVTSAEDLQGINRNWFDVALSRWGLMYFQSPVTALASAYDALKPGGKLVVAVWAEPEKVPYFSFPRDVLAKRVSVIPHRQDSSGTFRCCDMDQLASDFRATQFCIEHVEEMNLPVMKASTAKEVIQWTRLFGMNRLLNQLSSDIQSAWESDMLDPVDALRVGEEYQLGGVTRIVVARK